LPGPVPALQVPVGAIDDCVDVGRGEIGGVVEVALVDGGGAVVVGGLDDSDVGGGEPPFGGVIVGLIGTVPSVGVALQVLTWSPAVRDAKPSCWS
jgi:hypothetical protein